MLYSPLSMALAVASLLPGSLRTLTLDFPAEPVSASTATEMHDLVNSDVVGFSALRTMYLFGDEEEMRGLPGQAQMLARSAQRGIRVYLLERLH